MKHGVERRCIKVVLAKLGMCIQCAIITIMG